MITLSNKFNLFLNRKPDMIIIIDLLSVKTNSLMKLFLRHVFKKIRLNQQILGIT